VASGRVRDRVMVVKSANRTVSVTVRPATPATRIRLVTLVVSAKRPETRAKRLAALIADSNAKRKILPLRTNKDR